MEISLFSKCIKDLIVENDRVDVPYLGTFTAGMMPASYSDRQTTIHPPYRKMSFHKCEVSLSDGRLLLGKVAREAGVSLDQAGVELGWCLSRLSSELEGSKICKLPGLGVMRANARNEFYFVPDDDLDIWPDGIGFEAISIKVSDKATDDGKISATKTSAPEKVRSETAGPVAVDAGKPEVKAVAETAPGPAVSAGADAVSSAGDAMTARKRLHPLWIVLIAVGALLALFVVAAYLFTDQLSPILDRLLYSREELELLRGM